MALNCNHNNMVQVCGEARCATCYAEMLLSEKVFARDADVKIVMVPRKDGHRGLSPVAVRDPR